MKKLTDRGFSHILALLLVLFVVVAGAGWYVYSRQSKNNNTNGTGTANIQQENLQTSSDEYKTLMNKLQASFTARWGNNVYPPKYKEDTKGDNTAITEIKISQNVTAQIWKSYEWNFQGNYATENNIKEIFSEVGLTISEDESTEFQNNIAYCKLTIVKPIVNISEGSTTINCIDRKTKDNVERYSNEAFSTYKNLDVYKNLQESSKNAGYYLTYNTNSDNSATGIIISFPIMGYGRNVFMYGEGSGWKLVLAQSTAIEDVTKPLNTSECKVLASKEYKGVFDNYIKYDCK